MKKQMLYKGLAKYYDLVYSIKDYKKESERIRKLIKKYNKSKGSRVLEFACGTGIHAKYLSRYFPNYVGFDINEEVLRIARKRASGVLFKKGDMVTAKIDGKFDVVLCLFSSIGYVKTYPRLKKTLKSFYENLNPGGVLIFEPWFTKSDYHVGTPHSLLYNSKDIKIARLDVFKRKGNVSVFDMHFLVAERGKGTKHFVDRHELGLFEPEKTLRIMRDVGFDARHLKDEKNRGAYIGIKNVR